MKHEFIAKKDVEQRVGDILIVAKKGEKLLLSSREAEAATATVELEYVGPMTETEPEADLVVSSTEETLESLMKHKRDGEGGLVKKAAALGIAVNSDTKLELAKAILAKKDEIALGGGSEPDMPTTENSNNEVTE